MDAEEYAARQRRSAAKMVQPAKSKAIKRREKMERRRSGAWAWDNRSYDFIVTITLPDGELKVRVTQTNPDLAAKLAIYTHRLHLRDLSSSKAFNVVVTHSRRGVVLRGPCELPVGEEFLQVGPQPNMERPAPRGGPMPLPGVLWALGNARRRIAEKRQAEEEAAEVRKFSVDEPMDTPKFPG